MSVEHGLIANQHQPVTPAAPLQGRRGFWTRARREGLTGWLLVGPTMLYYGVMGLVPIGAVVLISFTRWNGVQGSPLWVGLKNYLYIWNYQQAVFTNTFVIAALLVLVGVPLA